MSQKKAEETTEPEFTSGVVREALHDREEALRGLFGLAGHARADRALIERSFDTPKSQRSASHSVALGNTEAETLSAKVRGLKIR
jgi:hypothetical protein